MPNSTLVDLVKIVIVNTGTGTLSLGTPVHGFRGAEALIDGTTYSYSIQQGANYEVGQGVYNAGGQSLTRGVIVSSYGDTAISLTPNAVVAFPALSIDFQIPGPPGDPGTPGTPGAAGPPGNTGAGINMPLSVQEADYTATVNDANTYVRFDSDVPVTFTIPAEADQPIAIADVIAFEQSGAGAVSVVGAAGVTINSRGAVNTTAGQYAVAQLKKISGDIWTLLGDVA